MTLIFSLQTDMNQIFQRRYCTLLKVKRLQKYQRSKLEFKKKNLPTRLIRGAWARTGLISRYFFETLTLNSGIFVAP